MLRLHDIMTRDLVALSPEHTLREALAALTRQHISGAPVITNGRLVGVVSLTDLAEFVAATSGVPTERPEHAEWGEFDEPVEFPVDEDPPSVFFHRLWDDAGAEVAERIEETGGPEWDALQEHTVSEAMTHTVLRLPPSTIVEAAAAYMRDNAIHRVLVMDEDRLLGIVTTTDIVRAVADGRLKQVED